jgi:hypothetical protein
MLTIPYIMKRLNVYNQLLDKLYSCDSKEDRIRIIKDFDFRFDESCVEQRDEQEDKEDTIDTPNEPDEPIREPVEPQLNEHRYSLSDDEDDSDDEERECNKATSNISTIVHYTNSVVDDILLQRLIDEHKSIQHMAEIMVRSRELHDTSEDEITYVLKPIINQVAPKPEPVPEPEPVLKVVELNIPEKTTDEDFEKLEHKEATVPETVPDDKEIAKDNALMARMFTKMDRSEPATEQKSESEAESKEEITDVPAPKKKVIKKVIRIIPAKRKVSRKID